MMTGLYTANVAYVPSKWKPLYLSEAWQIINGNHVLLNMITVFFKPFSHDNIFVNYMENPSDEMRNIPLADERIKQRLSAVYMAESLAFYRLKDLPVKQHHKVKLRHKISVISKLTKHIMFKTTGTVNVPKTLPYKVFDFIVFFFFL
jgi:hypothetical protein